MPISSEKELNRYSISFLDFEKAQQYICEAKKHDRSSIEYEALLLAAIVSYYRPFSSNEKSKLAKAKSRLFIEEFGSLTDSQKELHEKCKELRNKVIAHSAFEFNPTGIKQNTKVIVSRPYSLLNENFDLDSFETLLTQFVDLCHKKRADYIRSPAGVRAAP